MDDVLFCSVTCNATNLYTPTPTTEPTEYNGTQTTGQNIDLVSHDWDPGFTLGECEGDCDYDSDCQGELVCFHNDEHDIPPGCTGNVTWAYDYCAVSGNPNVTPWYPTSTTTTTPLTYCSSHDDCPGSDSFCFAWGYCIPCSSCYYCYYGIDGTCDSCGGAYPLYEDQCTTSQSNECCGCLEESWYPGCSANAQCESVVCDMDDWCCDYSWDEHCVEAAESTIDNCDSYSTTTTTSTDYTDVTYTSDQCNGAIIDRILRMATDVCMNGK